MAGSKLTIPLEGTGGHLKRDMNAYLLCLQWHCIHGLQELRREACKIFWLTIPLDEDDNEEENYSGENWKLQNNHLTIT